MKRNKRTLVADMLNLIDLIQIVESDKHEAYQVIHHAKAIIFKLSTGGTIKGVKAYLAEATKNPESLSYIMSDTAREIFAMYLIRNDMQFRVEKHKRMSGGKYYKQMQADYEELKAEFFVTERNFEEV